jgi:hypothetical protein
MRAAAPALPGVTWQGGTAEATGLATPERRARARWPRRSTGSAPTKRLSEFARVLGAGGRVALVWNRRSTVDPFTLGYREAILSVGAETAAERMPFDPAVFERSGVFDAPARFAFPHAQELDRAGLHGRARSASYVPKTGPRAGELGARLDALFDVHATDGRVQLVYECEVWRATRR